MQGLHLPCDPTAPLDQRIATLVESRLGIYTAGAQVRLMRPLDKGERKNKGEKPAAAEDVKKPKGDRPAPVSSAVADNDGKFTMTDIPVGKYMVMSRLKGQGQAREAVEVKARCEVLQMMRAGPSADRAISATCPT